MAEPMPSEMTDVCVWVCVCMHTHARAHTPTNTPRELIQQNYFIMQLNSVIPEHMDYCFLYWKHKNF